MKGKGIKAFGFALLGALALLFTGCGQQGGGGDKEERQTGPVDKVEILSVKDKWGVDLPVHQEKNANETVNLYASQTEEPVCVTVKVTDKDNNPVQGAQVRVSDPPQYIDLFPGCVSQPSPAGLDSVMTDKDGKAQFYIISKGVGSDSRLYTDSPVRFVVSASGEGGTAAQKEFKVYFWDISHLYYEEGSTKKPTEKRTGNDLGEISRSYYNFSDPAGNNFRFKSFVKRQSQAYYPGQGQDLLGYMEYKLEGGDTGKVQWVSGANNCEEISGGGLTCKDTNGSGVTLQPKPGVEDADLPISVKVKATLYVKVSYGEDPNNGQPLYYTFALKDYTFTKTWTGAALKIEQSGPSVIGWSGENYSPNDVTLKASLKMREERRDDGSVVRVPDPNVPEGARHTYTITVTNTSETATAKNVVITDPLPAELGFVEASEGGNYDPILHQVTWRPTDIEPGQSVSVTVTVYARHKPGEAWRGANTTDPSQPGYYNPSRPPRDTHPDPYSITISPEAKGENTRQVTTSKDIYVVRPFLELSNNFTVSNNVIRFTLTVENVDRASSDSGYQELKNNYPDDYKGALTAYSVKVRDLFSEGLAYSGSSPVGTPDENRKTLTLELGDLALGEKKEIQVFATGAGENCARLYAFNLNQPEDEPDAPVPDPRPSPPYTRETGNPDTVGNYLQSCSTVD